MSPSVVMGMRCMGVVDLETEYRDAYLAGSCGALDAAGYFFGKDHQPAQLLIGEVRRGSPPRAWGRRECAPAVRG